MEPDRKVKVLSQGEDKVGAHRRLPARISRSGSSSDWAWAWDAAVDVAVVPDAQDAVGGVAAGDAAKHRTCADPG